MAIFAWIVEGTWPACVDAVKRCVPQDADVSLLYVADHELPEAAHDTYAGLLGRGQADRDPGPQLKQLERASEARLLRAATDRLDRPCTWLRLVGRPEREVVTAAAGAELLVVARDGDRRQLGPASLGPHTRFVVDHASCPVLLVWPEMAPSIGTIPPRPRRP